MAKTALVKQLFALFCLLAATACSLTRQQDSNTMAVLSPAVEGIVYSKPNIDCIPARVMVIPIVQVDCINVFTACMEADSSTRLVAQ